MPPSVRIDSWDDWTRVYNDVSVWRGLIDAICTREGIGYRQLQPASANTNAVFLLDRAYALKIYSPFWDECELECALLNAFEDEEGIPAPRVVGSGHIAEADGVSWAYLITCYCSARPFSEIRQQLSDDDAGSLATQLGRTVRTLHALDPSRFANAATARSWLDVVAERRRQVIDELTDSGVLGTSIVPTFASLLDDAIARDRPESRVVVHGDLGPDHVLCASAGEGWNIEALIDFGDAKIGVPEYEWMPVWMGFSARDPDLARAFLAAYDPTLLADPEFPKRAIAWTLLHDFSADELKRLWRERGRPAPLETLEELQALLCSDAIFR